MRVIEIHTKKIFKLIQFYRNYILNLAQAKPIWKFWVKFAGFTKKASASKNSKFLNQILGVIKIVIYFTRLSTIPSFGNLNQHLDENERAGDFCSLADMLQLRILVLPGIKFYSCTCKYGAYVTIAVSPHFREFLQ